MLNNNLQLLGYGRTHWFLFSDSKLVKVIVGKNLLSNEILNQIPFDERFDNNKWEFINTDGSAFSYKQTLLTQSQPNALIVKVDERVYEFEVQTFLNENGFTSRKVITGFSHYLSPFKDTRSMSVANNTCAYNELENWFNLRDEDSLLGVSDVNCNPIGTVTLEQNKSLLIFDNHLAGRVSGTAIDKLFVFESITNSKQIITQPYEVLPKILNLGLGMTIENVRAVTSENDIFEYSDLMEITASGYTYNLFFHEKDDHSVIYQSEIVLY